MAQGRLIVFSIARAQLLGGPLMLHLSTAEARATERAFLGGMEALRTPEYRCACKTVDALVNKGILGHDGLTPLGRACGEAIGRPE